VYTELNGDISINVSQLEPVHWLLWLKSIRQFQKSW